MFSLAQSIGGTWYSGDGTRKYEIRQVQGAWVAVLISSTRTADKPGFTVISDLQQHGKKWEGIIRSAADSSSSTRVSIRYNPKSDDKLKLKLDRMLFLDISIRWYRQDPNAPEKNGENFGPPPPPPAEF